MSDPAQAIALLEARLAELERELQGTLRKSRKVVGISDRCPCCGVPGATCRTDLAIWSDLASREVKSAAAGIWRQYRDQRARRSEPRWAKIKRKSVVAMRGTYLWTGSQSIDKVLANGVIVDGKRARKRTKRGLLIEEKHLKLSQRRQVAALMESVRRNYCPRDETAEAVERRRQEARDLVRDVKGRIS